MTMLKSTRRISTDKNRLYMLESVLKNRGFERKNISSDSDVIETDLDTLLDGTLINYVLYRIDEELLVYHNREEKKKTVITSKLRYPHTFVYVGNGKNNIHLPLFPINIPFEDKLLRNISIWFELKNLGSNPLKVYYSDLKL